MNLISCGTAKDGFDGKYRYTGKLRSVMPLEEVPKRTVPDHIPKPDYATEGERSVLMSARLVPGLTMFVDPLNSERRFFRRASRLHQRAPRSDLHPRRDRQDAQSLQSRCCLFGLYPLRQH